MQYNLDMVMMIFDNREELIPVIQMLQLMKSNHLFDDSQEFDDAKGTLLVDCNGIRMEQW